ncbi:hypothetical protein [Micromonospora sp. DT233]|uniref:hypothetical protein n=1 Tax=Micromonospora sp. DT233 TaxID=3393432 RepID=UPI003CF0B771
MGEATGVRAIGRDPTMLVDAAAALAVGVVFAGRGVPLAAQSGFVDLVRGGQPLRPAVLACLAVAVAVTLPALLPRLPGWPVALGGLLLTFLTDLAVAGGAHLLPTSSPAPGLLLAALVGVAGTGLALGGALLAVGQASRPGRRLVAAGLAGGLVLHPVSTALAVLLLPGTESHGPRPEVQLWLPVLLTVGAMAVAWRRARVTGPAFAGRFRPGPLLVVGVAATLALVGLTVRWWVVQQFRLSPDGLAGPRREQAVQGFQYFSAVVLAVVVGLVLLGYAYRLGRAVGARWVVLCVAAGPISLYGVRLSFSAAPGRACLITAVGVAAVAVGAMLARHAPRLLPWDALGLLVAAVALPMSAPVVRAELPSVDIVMPLLTVLGLGLAFGFGTAFAATASIGTASDAVPTSAPTAPGPAPTASDVASAAADAVAPAAPGPGVAAPSGPSIARPDIGGRVALLVLGPAAWMLSAQILASVVTRSQFDGPYQGPAFTVPVFAGMAALLLAAFFGFGRAVDRLRQDLRAESVPLRRP